MLSVPLQQLWPTHKFLCKLEDQSTFRFPPLTKAEANFVRQHMKDIEVISGFTQKMPGFAGHKLIDFFEWIGMYEGTLEVNLSLLRLDLDDSDITLCSYRI